MTTQFLSFVILVAYFRAPDAGKYPSFIISHDRVYIIITCGIAVADALEKLGGQLNQGYYSELF